MSVRPGSAEDPEEPFLSDDGDSKTSLDEENGGGFAGGVFNIANAALGAGLLAFPFAFRKAGLGVGIALQIVLAFLVASAIIVLAECARVTESTTYQQMIRRMLGRTPEICSVIAIVLFAWSACVAFLVVIGDQMESFATNSEALADLWCFKRKVVVAGTGILFVWPLGSFRDMAMLSFTSFLAVASCVYVCGFVFVAYFMEDYKDRIHPEPSSSFFDVVSAMPLLTFGYQCHVSSVPIFASLKPSVQREFYKIPIVAVCVDFTVYTITGVAGYLAFKGDAKGDILESFDASDLGANVGRSAIALAVATSYPLLAFCVRTVINDLLETNLPGMFPKIPGEPSVGPFRRSMLIAAGWFFSTLTMAIFVPGIVDVLGIAGNLAAAVMFVLPGMCAVRLSHLACKEEHRTTQKKLSSGHHNAVTSPRNSSPSAAAGDCSEQWLVGMEGRMQWLSPTQQRALSIYGILLIALGIGFFFLGMSVSIYDDITGKS